MAENNSQTNQGQQNQTSDSASQQGQGGQQDQGQTGRQGSTQQQQDSKTKFASAGKPEVVNRVSPSGQKQNIQQKSSQQQNAQGSNQQQSGSGGETNQGGESGGSEDDKSKNAPAFDNDQVAAVLKQTFGDDYDLEKIKSVLNKKPTEEQHQETDDEKKQREQKFEQRMLEFFVENGEGDLQRFAHLKEIAEADLTQLSEATLKHGLKKEGFSDEEIAAIVKERYYQLSDEEIEAEQDDKLKEFLKRKKQFGSNRIKAQGETLQKTAKETLDRIKKSVETLDSVETAEKEFSSKAEEFFSKLPRELEIKLGKVGDDQQEVAPIKFQYSEDDVNKVLSVLKDPKQRKQILFNEDNSLNLEKVAKLLLDAESQRSLLLKTYQEGGDREIAKLETRFPSRSAHDVGLRGGDVSQAGKTGKLVSVGKPQVVKKHN